MTKLLRLLPLLVVGCLLLQSLQTANADGDECVQDIEDEAEDSNYGDASHDGKKRKPDQGDQKENPKNKRPKTTMTFHGSLGLTKRSAQERLVTKFKDCTNKNLLKQHNMPFKIDDTAAKTSNNDHLKTLCQDSYIIRYSTGRKTPLFTAERLDGAVLEQQRTQKKRPVRRNNAYFRPDPRLGKSERSTCNEYSKSGFDRGHVAPSGDMTSDIYQINSFMLSNMAPQHPNHNRHAWKNWEGYTRSRAEEKKILFVITGVTGSIPPPPDKNIDKVMIPGYWYKILVWCENGVIQAECIFTVHEDKSRPDTFRITTEKEDPKSINGIAAEKKRRTVVEIEKFIKGRTKIDFKISSSSVCKVPLSQLSQISTAFLQ